MCLQYGEIFDEKTKTRMKRIQRAIIRISHQVNDVLDFVRTNPLTLESVSLKSILLSSIESITLPKGIKLIMPKSDVMIIVDYHQIEIVFSNILINSIQSLDKSGELKIKFIENVDNAQIQIIDSGSGIPEDNLSKIFDPLFTTKQTGTGLGLASCKTIVEKHNGAINVQNNPTTFTITLSKNLKISKNP